MAEKHKDLSNADNAREATETIFHSGINFMVENPHTPDTYVDVLADQIKKATELRQKMLTDIRLANEARERKRIIFNS
jgi:hypothetical protein